MLIIGPNPFISQSSPDHSPQPRINFSYYEISGPDICSLICAVKVLVQMTWSLHKYHGGLPMRKLSYFLCLACFTVTLLCYLQTKTCFASHDHSCPQITLPHMRNTSQWSEFVTNANFVNVNEAEAIQEFVDQITELQAILNHLSEVSYSYLSPILSSTYCK